MGRSASRLSKTRSGVVSPFSLPFLIFLFPQPAPVPPLALLRRKQRIFCLRNGGTKNIQATDILPLPLDTVQCRIHGLRISSGKPFNTVDAQLVEVAQHGGA